MNEIIKILTPSTATPINYEDIDYSNVSFDSAEEKETPEEIKEKMEDVMVDVNKDLKNEMMAFTPINDKRILKKYQELVNNYDWDKIIELSNQYKLNEIILILRNYKMLEDLMKNTIKYPQYGPSEPLALPYKNVPTIKVEEVDSEDTVLNEELAVPITEEKNYTDTVRLNEKEEKVEEKEEPKHEKEEIPKILPLPETLPQQSPESRYQRQKYNEQKKVANTFVSFKNQIDDYLKNDIPGSFLKVSESALKTDYVLEEDTRKIIIEKYNNGSIKEVYSENTGKNYIIDFNSSDNKYTYLEYQGEKLLYKVVYKKGDNTVNVRKGIRGKPEDIIFTEYGKGYKIKYTSGSIIDKIRNKFLKNINSEISSLKKEDKTIYSKLDSLQKQIEELKESLNKKESKIPTPPLIPETNTKNINFLDEILEKKPLKPIINVPKDKTKKEELTDLQKAMMDRRKDIEYSEDSDDSDEEWGEGVKRHSIPEEGYSKKNKRRIEILEFLKSLDS